MSGFQSFAIVPAAGKSLRMGTAKLLLPWQGRTLIEHLLAAWRQSDVGCVVVVARRDDRPLVELLQCHDVDLVLPDEPPPQMKDSVQAALVHIRDRYRPRPHDAWLLAPADLPRLSSAVINQLLAAYQAAPCDVLVPCWQQQRGHPVLFAWRQHEAVFRLAADQGVNTLLHEMSVRELPTSDPSTWSDVDRPEDLRRLNGAGPEGTESSDL
jgi:molybdenum cofactor cytidylyltransferase